MTTLAYDAGSNLARLRERLPGASPDELRRFIKIAERTALRAGRYGFKDRAAYWREARELAAAELVRREAAVQGMTIDISVPGRVWDDALDPNVSGMQAELGLPLPVHKSSGKGWRAIYRQVPVAVAEELAEYVGDRGATLLGQGYRGMSEDPEVMRARGTYRAAVKAAEGIRQQVAAVKATAWHFCREHDPEGVTLLPSPASEREDDGGA